MENDYINDALLGKISREQNVKISQIRAVLQLIEGGATVPFIARYRKEVTGGLDEEQIRAIYTEWDYGQKLAQRKEDVMRLIEEKGKLTPELNIQGIVHKAENVVINLFLAIFIKNFVTTTRINDNKWVMTCFDKCFRTIERTFTIKAYRVKST